MAINPIEHIQSKGKQMWTPSNSNIEFTLNSWTFNDSFTKNDSNNMVISRKRVSEDRNHLQPLSVPYHPFSFKPEHDDILNKRRIITRRIIPKTDEKQMDSFLFKLEKTLIENKLKWSERDDEWITKRILINDFNSPERSEFEFTFSKSSTIANSS